MKVGIFIFATDRTIDVAVLAKKAEELGFESFWLPEHVIIPVDTTSPFPGSSDGIIPEYYGRIADPFISLARASAVTQSIKLATGVCLVPERNAILLAKEVATLDRMSGGRFLFGIGTGWLKEESEILGGDFPHRWTHAKDSILAMKELWKDGPAEYHGTHNDFPPVKLVPKPVQRPHPPIYLGGKAKNVFKRIVEWADGWMPNRISPEEVKAGRSTLNELALAAGRDPGSIEVTVFGGTDHLKDRDLLPALEDAGADRMTLWLGEAENNSVLNEMEGLAKLFMP